MDLCCHRADLTDVFIHTGLYLCSDWAGLTDLCLNILDWVCAGMGLVWLTCVWTYWTGHVQSLDWSDWLVSVHTGLPFVLSLGWSDWLVSIHVGLHLCSHLADLIDLVFVHTGLSLCSHLAGLTDLQLFILELIFAVIWLVWLTCVYSCWTRSVQSLGWSDSLLSVHTGIGLCSHWAGLTDLCLFILDWVCVVIGLVWLTCVCSYWTGSVQSLGWSEWLVSVCTGLCLCSHWAGVTDLCLLMLDWVCAVIGWSHWLVFIHMGLVLCSHWAGLTDVFIHTG